VLWWLSPSQPVWIGWSLLERTWHLTLVVLAGAAVYFAALFAAGMRVSDYTRRGAL
jgi:putative peptidoglycan lipid II flippase